MSLGRRVFRDGNTPTANLPGLILQSHEDHQVLSGSSQLTIWRFHRADWLPESWFWEAVFCLINRNPSKLPKSGNALGPSNSNIATYRRKHMAGFAEASYCRDGRQHVLCELASIEYRLWLSALDYGITKISQCNAVNSRASHGLRLMCDKISYPFVVI